MISERTIQQVRDLDIETVLKPYMQLKRKGSSLMGLCPFHSEKTPSFSVSPQKNRYHCFGCCRGGDGIGFVMEKENLTFLEAVEKIANDNNIPIERIEKDRTEEEMSDYRHRESLLAINDLVHRYFVDCLRTGMNDESRHARDYSYGRWTEDFCAESGIGYAPKNGNAFIEYCNSNSIPTELLQEVGLVKKNDTGITYAFFRERIIIPIRNRWGRIIGFTGRYIGSNKKTAKYLNSSNSAIYDKGTSLFGIDRASRKKSSDIIIVEGAPDVLRLQSVGLDNVVATLGTSWSDTQFDLLRKITKSVCFIPDSDIAEGKLFGSGFEAVMKNGASALRKGLEVTVRELPFAEVPMSSEELRELYPDMAEPPEDAPRVKPGKNDADSYIKNKEDYFNLPEKYFVVWLAEKRFFEADSLVKQRAAVSEIADLLTYVNDQLIVEQCIEQLSKIHGRTKFWRDAISQARGENRRRKDSTSALDERQREVDALRQAGLFIRDNCYYTIGSEEEDPVIISNFVMEPMFHIGDDNNGTRIFILKNEAGDRRLLEIRESEMCSLNAFQQKVGTLGNFIWLAKIEKLNRVKRYLYAKTDTAERVRKLGWDSI
ncbi:MAG: DNA primase, partial [Muribaculaceae bacterium]|nr:DNA primase [Muribaculaceae bacterium]